MNNGGARHRRRLGSRCTWTFYKWLCSKGYPPGYQVLCYNCNCGRYRNGGVCPHKDPRYRDAGS